MFCPALVFGQVGFQSSDLPIVIITTNNGEAIPDEPKITARMKVIDKGPGLVNFTSDAPNGYDGFIGVERRGSSSQDLSEKKPFAVETRDTNGDDLDVPLLGMPAESDWVFIAPYNDKSLVRDAFTLEMARRIMAWAPRTRFVELVLNGSYEGIYMVTEKIKRGKGRVNIAKLTENDIAGDDLTGGYIIKFDKSTGAQVDGWVSPYPAEAGSWQSTFYQFHYPSPDFIVPEQRQYIENWVTDFEYVMATQSYADSLAGYPKYLDVESFINFIIINEITKNVDAYRLSTYMYKDKDSNDSRLYAGPVWDFNIALGNANYCNAQSYLGWAIEFNKECGQDGWIIHFWWRRLWEAPAFQKRLRSRWKELRSDLFKTENLTAIVDSMVGTLNQSQVRNWQRWPVLYEWVWPNSYCCGTYQQHVSYMRSWLISRLQWIDGKMSESNTGPYSPSLYFKTRVWPNPSDNDLTFKYYVRSTDEVLLRIYNAEGRLLHYIQTPAPTISGENQFTWPHQLSRGFYFYTVIVNGRVESDGKFIVK